jgi:hypothetical protein
VRDTDLTEASVATRAVLAFWCKVDALIAVGCLAISFGVGYAAYRLIKAQHPQELPDWGPLLLALVFITSAVHSGTIAYRYGLLGRLPDLHPETGQGIRSRATNVARTERRKGFDALPNREAPLRAPWGMMVADRPRRVIQ